MLQPPALRPPRRRRRYIRGCLSRGPAPRTQDRAGQLHFSRYGGRVFPSRQLSCCEATSSPTGGSSAALDAKRDRLEGQQPRDPKCRLDIAAEFARIAVTMTGETALAGMDTLQRAGLALRALNAPDVRDRRLLVLDDAHDESLLIVRDVHNNVLRNWIPGAGSCHTIITSRYTAWSPTVSKVTLDVLGKEDAARFLVKRSGKDPEGFTAIEQAACGALAERLGSLPLALEVAASYIEREGKDYRFADYLAFYERSQERALREHSHGFTEYPESVYTTWRITLAKLARAESLNALTSASMPSSRLACGGPSFSQRMTWGSMPCDTSWKSGRCDLSRRVPGDPCPSSKRSSGGLGMTIRFGFASRLALGSVDL